ncbi:MAG TPA: hypothetical protein VGS96_15110 [Thermoanaerobaculia bacterium]|jgi:spore maturation protein SpmA|nr:hypothetical protein [Thermoanaerobaculia bacterium]
MFWLMIVVVCVLMVVAVAPIRATAPPADQLTQVLWPALMQTACGTVVVVVIVRIVEALQIDGGGEPPHSKATPRPQP